MLATADIFLFEELRLDRQGDGLSRRDKRGVFVPISIGLRALDVLVVLVERSGHLVSKEEIMAAVWGRAVVENANLTVQVAALRRVLEGDRKAAVSRPSLGAVTGLFTQLLPRNTPVDLAKRLRCHACQLSYFPSRICRTTRNRNISPTALPMT